MRFLEDGPSIPNELLWARDEGRVVLFCGAGVSRAKAGLPDFLGLFESVAARLGLPAESKLYGVAREIRTLEERTGVAGLVAVDRLFGILSKEFSQRDIESATAAALRHQEQCDLSAHRTLLEIARLADGSTRLVTTNFDRLFSIADSELVSWTYPKFPDPRRGREFNGVVYLHGRASVDYESAESGGFVLSSADFGTAYLSEGAARQFVQQMVDRFVVVFIGYAADDPPVQYLLEALQAEGSGARVMYAFHAGSQLEADDRWRQKGVTPIAYDAGRNHERLWRTLEAWAVRAKNVDAWYSQTIGSALAGPAGMAPHERGQIAHVLASYEGAKRFAGFQPSPPAEWICVLDPARRFARPERRFDGGEPFGEDPFQRYGIDDDTPPAAQTPDNYAERAIPPGAWDAFSISRMDRASASDRNCASFRGPLAGSAPQLMARHSQIAAWISRVSAQPAAIWWAGLQTSVHPDAVKQIDIEVRRSDTHDASTRRAWRLIFEMWASSNQGDFIEWYDLVSEVRLDGWSSAAIRRYGESRRPWLSAMAGKKSGVAALSSDNGALIALDVTYPSIRDEIEVPEPWLIPAIHQLTANLEVATRLEQDIGGYGLEFHEPLDPDAPSDDTGFQRTHGLSGCVIEFASLFERLVAHNSFAANAEFGVWANLDGRVFERLRIWAVRFEKLVAPEVAAEVLLAISDSAFWNYRHQRDLLTSLRARWNQLPESDRNKLANRIAAGPPKWSSEQEDDEHRSRAAHQSLSRLEWLASEGCQLPDETQPSGSALRALAPDWKPDFARSAASSTGIRGGWVRQDVTATPLLAGPLKKLVSRARELNRRDGDDILVEANPFAGLVKSHPVRAISAIRLAEEGVEWAWATFLASDSRGKDRTRMLKLIANRLLRIPNSQFATILSSVANWVSNRLKGADSEQLPVLKDLFVRLVDGLASVEQEKGQAAFDSSAGRRWVMDAINSSAGKLTQSILDLQGSETWASSSGLPGHARRLVDALLGLTGDPRRHVLVILCHNFQWLSHLEPGWAEENLARVLDSDSGPDRDAAWAGFLWGGGRLNESGYRRLKPRILEMATDAAILGEDNGEVLAAMLLSGWVRMTADGDQLISDGELRSVLARGSEKFRMHSLWLLYRWANSEQPNWFVETPRLLRTVWPRQLSARSPGVSARLIELAFARSDWVEEMAKAIQPLLTKIDSDHISLPELRKAKDEFVDAHPGAVLGLLHAALPKGVGRWPYGIEEIVTRLARADSALASDVRYLELKRAIDLR